MDEEKQVRRRAADARLARVSELNAKYEAYDYYDAKGEGRNYQVILGKVPILVSAPHAVRQIREGVVKERDGMTGGIVEYLCEELGLFGITRLWEAGDDPNYAQDERSVAYRNEIVRLVKEYGIKWVLDVHGCLNKHGFDLDIGVNGGANVACGMDVVEKWAENWRQQGMDVRVDGRFVAEWPYVVSNEVHRKTGVDCLQLELSGNARTTPEGLEKFFRGLVWNLSEVVGCDILGA